MGIKDYLHFYLGGKCHYKYIDWDNWDEQVIDLKILDRLYGDYSLLVKPILRPLSDMTKGELVEIFKLVSLFDLSECSFEFGENEYKWVNAVFNGRVVDCIQYIGDALEAMNNDGSFSLVNPQSKSFIFFTETRL